MDQQPRDGVPPRGAFRCDEPGVGMLTEITDYNGIGPCPTRGADMRGLRRAAEADSMGCGAGDTEPGTELTTRMANHTETRDPRDYTRIDLSDQRELPYWCARFRCTGSDLRAAIDSVGVRVKQVEAYLKRRERNQTRS